MKSNAGKVTCKCRAINQNDRPQKKIKITLFQFRSEIKIKTIWRVFPGGTDTISFLYGMKLIKLIGKLWCDYIQIDKNIL